MKATETMLLHFLEGADKNFSIPVYQRNYDWAKEHCTQLFNDLLDISKIDKTHFLGSIVSIYHFDSDSREYSIIDGQQRLTTLSILLIAICKIIENENPKTEVNEKQIKESYLINPHKKDTRKIKLKPIKDDNNAFEKLFEHEKEYITDSKITVNFLYFYNRILEEKISVDKLYKAIRQLVIVDIELKIGEDDPQLIFESLNSTGLDLSEADKVRNFILMKESPQRQEELYTKYWNPIEKNTNHNNVSDFIRDYLTLKERAIPNKRKVYFHFKDYVNQDNNETEVLLQDLLKFSTYYEKIINSENLQDQTSIEINKLNKIETIVAYPFLMELFSDIDEGILSNNEMAEICKIIVDFVFRRVLCEVPTNALNKMFMTLGRDIKKYKDYSHDYVEVFKYSLINKPHSQRFPTDEEFSERFIKKDIYNLKSKNRIFLLEQLENYNNKERVEVEKLIEQRKLSVEHIMPQTLKRNWVEALGENHRDIHDKYLHTIGNITLTGYNSTMSNKSFSEKQNMVKGFNESRLYLNSSLRNLKKWNEQNIKKRAKELLNRALIIWPLPSTTYQSEAENLKSFTLFEDDYNFSSKKISSYKFLDTKQKNITSWEDFYIQICKELHELDPINFKKSIHHGKYNSYNETKIKTEKLVKIGDFYINSNLNAETLLSRLRIIFKNLGLDLDDAEFTIEA